MNDCAYGYWSLTRNLTFLHRIHHYKAQNLNSLRLSGEGGVRYVDVLERSYGMILFQYYVWRW